MIAIDLGSNTLRVLVYDCMKKKQVFAYEKVVKTADKLAENGIINDEAIQRIIVALKEVQKQVNFSTRVHAVSTQAMRSASNAKEVLKKIKTKTGVNFNIILGEEEARLTLLAVKNRLEKLHYASSTFVLIDIGGGSTELIFQYASKIISKSFPIGIVTIAQKYNSLDSIQKALAQEMLAMQMFCAETYAINGKLQAFVATAGTPTTVAAMKLGQEHACYDASKINGTLLELEELDFYLEKLLSMSFEKREQAVGTGRS
ncbi:MAG: phosphatase, partial [Epsilonproteobacteria bacterium]